MTLSVDVFWSFRSPYSYLAAPQLAEIARVWDVDFTIRVVRPLAVRDPGFFKRRDPRWVHYVITDTLRLAEMHAIPYGFPNPDPIVQDLDTLEIAAEQPHIFKLNRLGTLAAEQGAGLAYIVEASRLIWGGPGVNGDTPWTQAGRLEGAARAAGLDGDALRARAEDDAARLDAVVEANEAAQEAAGHWGVPLMVFDGEPFFGQDRIDALVWRLKQKGLKAR